MVLTVFLFPLHYNILAFLAVSKAFRLQCLPCQYSWAWAPAAAQLGVPVPIDGFHGGKRFIHSFETCAWDENPSIQKKAVCGVIAGCAESVTRGAHTSACCKEGLLRILHIGYHELLRESVAVGVIHCNVPSRSPRKRAFVCSLFCAEGQLGSAQQSWSYPAYFTGGMGGRGGISFSLLSQFAFSLHSCWFCGPCCCALLLMVYCLNLRECYS